MGHIGEITNATKAQIIAAVNAVLGLLAVFGVGLSDAQTGAIILAVNALLSLWVALTYEWSRKRVVDRETVKQAVVGKRPPPPKP